MINRGTAAWKFMRSCWVNEIGRSHDITFTVRYHSVSEEVVNTHFFLELEETGNIMSMPVCLWMAQCARDSQIRHSKWWQGSGTSWGATPKLWWCFPRCCMLFPGMMLRQTILASCIETKSKDRSQPRPLIFGNQHSATTKPWQPRKRTKQGQRSVPIVAPSQHGSAEEPPLPKALHSQQCCFCPPCPHSPAGWGRGSSSPWPQSTSACS